MIVSEGVTYGEVFGVLERVTKTLGRQVNPTVYTAAEFSKRGRQENALVRNDACIRAAEGLDHRWRG
ncbi:MAG: hypothetical protein ABI837_16430 [Acidobacteriota bacterium]